VDRVGELIVTSLTNRWDPWPDSIYLVQADPIVLISHKFLVELTYFKHLNVDVNGAIFTIKGSNYSVTYAVGEYVIDRDAYLCRWPD
jgi:hypothetical protein